MLKSRGWTAAFLLAVAFGCDSPPSTLPLPAASQRAIATQSTLDAEIRSLITNGYPKGQATSLLAKWDQVLKSLAKEPKTTLKGKTVPGSGGRTELTRTLDYAQSKTSTVTPPAGETQEHYVARLALAMSLYVYSGPSTPVPLFTPSADIAFEIVQPEETDTVVTPEAAAAVIFPAGAVVEQTIVVITPVEGAYPENCSGPLDTQLCQYPRFYHFNVFPDVKLAAPAKVQVCHMDEGASRGPLADHDRFRVAHEKPANPADYSAGSTIVDNIEILAFAPMNVTTCEESEHEHAAAPSGRPRGALQWLGARAAQMARAVFVPRDAIAIDVGGGGFAEDFSIFGTVDPQSKQDLSQSSPVTFSLSATSVNPGATVVTSPWTVTNRGSGTSTSFTSSLVLATDSLLTSPVTTVPLAGQAALVPHANFNYASQSLTLPTSAGPGTYYVGTRVIPLGTDSSATNNLVSVRLTVVATAPPPSALHAGSSPWTASGPGVAAPYVELDSVSLSYNSNPSNPSYAREFWAFTTTAPASGSYTFSYKYAGFHSFFQVDAYLEVFVNGPSGETVIPLNSFTCPGSCPTFNLSGTQTITLHSGYTWGIRANGKHFDTARVLQGTISIYDYVPVIL